MTTSTAGGVSLFVPGRLCLFGEHSDWAGGYRASHPHIEPGACLVVGTDQGLRATAAPLEGVLELTTRLPDGPAFGPERIPLELATLDEVARGTGFFSYAAATAREMCERYPVGGLRLEVEADLPVRKGLSSSAAVCVLVVRAFSELHGLGLGPREEMALAYAGERRTGSECGRMDQVCAFGRRVTSLHFDAEAFEVEPIAPAGAFHLLVIDLQRGKDTRRILSDLNACFPEAPGRVAEGVREALGRENRALVGRARAAVEAGDARALGALMTEAQALFDAKVAPACPELRAPRLHEVLAHPALAELAFGGKGVGSQGDGCAQIVARDAAARDALAVALERDFDVRCLPLTLEPRATG